MIRLAFYHDHCSCSSEADLEGENGQLEESRQQQGWKKGDRFKCKLRTELVRLYGHKKEISRRLRVF